MALCQFGRDGGVADECHRTQNSEAVDGTFLTVTAIVIHPPTVSLTILRHRLVDAHSAFRGRTLTTPPELSLSAHLRRVQE